MTRRETADEPERFITSSVTSETLRRLVDMQTGGRRDETGDVLCPVELMLDAADEIDRLRDALFWCGGSPSFAPGGEAHEGWEKMVRPLMRTGE